jgi:hypothetical protein
MDGIPIEILRLSLPVIRCDFHCLETYRPISGNSSEFVMRETITDDYQNLSDCDKVSCPVTIIGGGEDIMVPEVALIGWTYYVNNIPHSIAPKYKQHEEQLLSAATQSRMALSDSLRDTKQLSTESNVCSMNESRRDEKLFNSCSVHVDSENGHFYAFDKVNGGEAWAQALIKNVCLLIPTLK